MQQSGGNSTQMVPPSVRKYSSLKRADLYQEGSWLRVRRRLNHSSQGGDAPVLDQPQEVTRKVLPSTLPVVQDGLLPCFDLPLPLLVVCQGIM